MRKRGECSSSGGISPQAGLKDKLPFSLHYILIDFDL